MKNSIYNSIIFAIGIFGLASTGLSCKKALEVEPYSYFSSGNFFKNENEAYLATLGIYEVMSRPETYGWYVPMVYENDNDITQIDQGGIVDPWRAIPHYNGIAETGYFYQTWSAFYAGIDRANVVMETIPKMGIYNTGSQGQKDQLNRMLGEAKFLRAFYYSELVRLWGDVPLKLESSKAGQNFKLPKTDRYIVYDQIIKDIREAALMLPAELPTDERVNRWAAKAILARIALYAGGYSLHQNGTMQRPANYKDYYTIAQTELNDVMSQNLYKLSTDYTKLFKDQCQNILTATENMFQVAFYNPTGTGVENSLGVFYSPLTTQGLYRGAPGRGRATRTFYLDFNPADLRRDFSIATYTIGAAGQKLPLLTARQDEAWTVAKWSPEYQNNVITEKSTTSINTVILRYSDVLLMRAEVENELNEGPNAAAYAAINEVRRRGFGLNIPGSQIKVDLANAGSDYTGPPIVTITGGGGSGAAAAITTLVSGRVASILMLSSGTGYTSAPTVTITPNPATGPGTGATATATVLPKPTTEDVDLTMGLDKAQFLTELQKERAFELSFEGVRRSDLIRWNLLGTKIKETADRLKAYRANYAYPAGQYFIPNKHEIYPIPLNEIDVNKSIIQNPGY